MKTLFRVLGAAAAVAATGAAIVVLDKILNDKGPLHVEEVEFEKASEEKASEEPEAPAAQPATAEEKPVAEEAPVNPVEAGPAVAPKDETGKFDVTKIAEASDFTGVEEESGCKS